MSKFACSSKNCEKLEKSKFLLKLIKTNLIEEVEGCPVNTTTTYFRCTS